MVGVRVDGAVVVGVVGVTVDGAVVVGVVGVTVTVDGVGIPGDQFGQGGMMIGIGSGIGAGTTPGAGAGAGATGAGTVGVACLGTTPCTVGIVPPWNPAVGASGGGGGTGACC